MVAEGLKNVDPVKNSVQQIRHALRDFPVPRLMKPSLDCSNISNRPPLVDYNYLNEKAELKEKDSHRYQRGRMLVLSLYQIS
jgi:hypothetical protein